MLDYINKRWSILRRLLLIAMIAFMPSVFIIRLIYVADLAQIASTKDELVGLKQVSEVWQIMTGSANSSQRLSEATRKAIAGYDAKTAAALAEFESAKQPVDLAEHGEKLINRIAGASGISLDPESATYYLGDIVTAQTTGAMGHWATANVIAGSAGEAEKPGALETQLALLDQHLEAILTNIDWLGDNKDASAVVTRLKSDAGKIEHFRGEIAKLLKSTGSIDAAKSQALVAGLNSTLLQVRAAVSAEFEQMLDARINRLWSGILTNTAIVGVLSLLAIAIAIAVARSFSASLRGQVASMQLISEGSKDAHIEFVGSPNENGMIAAALEKLRAGVSERLQLAEETQQQLKEREELNSYYLYEHERFMKEFLEGSKKIASGNFQHRLTGKVIDEYKPIVEEINRMAQALFDTQKQMQASVQLRDAVIEGLDKSQLRIEFDMDGTILSANENYLRGLGYSASELVGRHQSQFLDEAVRNSSQVRDLWDALKRGEWRQAQTKRKTKGGQEIWLEASYNPVRDISGKLVKIVAYAANVTEKVNADRVLQQAVAEVKTVVAAARANDLTQRAPMAGKTGEIAELCSGVNGLLDTMSGVIGNISSSTGVIANASRELAMGNMELSQRTEEQAASLEETAASLGEFTSTVKQNAENAQKANDLATSASQVAVKGGQVVAEVISTMDGISQASRKIADIIGVIDEISFQTNILALNAAVEAARAGEQGRGFAVVASEVRSLAQRSTNAAKEIKTLISDSVARVETGAKLVESAGKTMEDLVSGVEGVSRIMAEISAASREQSEGIEQVNTAVMQMDKITQQNAALVEEAAAAAKSMEEQTATLESVVSAFQIDNGGRAGLGASRRPGMAPTGNPVVDTAFRKAGGGLPVQRPASFKATLKPVSKPSSAPAKRATSSGGAGGDWTEF